MIDKSSKYSNGLDYLKNGNSRIFKNIEHDKQLNINKRRESFYLQLVKLTGKNSAELKEYCVKYFRDHKKLGVQNTTLDGVNVGHVVVKRRLCQDIVSELKNYKIKKGITNPARIEKSLNDIIRYKRLAKFDEFKRKYSGIQFRKYLTWSFINKKQGSSFFDNINIDKLSCQLGLQDTVKPKFAVSHRITEDTQPFAPTAFDAGFNIFWRPGGKTYPLGECKDDEGHSEVVHEPNLCQFISEIDETT